MLYKETYKKNREKSGQVNTKEEKGIEDFSTKKMKKMTFLCCVFCDSTFFYNHFFNFIVDYIL